MPLKASFTEVRRNLTAITDKVMADRVSVTVFKHNKPAFKIVPVETLPEVPDMQAAYIDAADAMDRDYYDVFEALAK